MDKLKLNAVKSSLEGRKMMMHLGEEIAQRIEELTSIELLS